MDRTPFIVVVLGFIVGAVVGWMLSARRQFVSGTTTTTDTVRYYKPIEVVRQPIEVAEFGRLAFVEGKRDTVVKVVTIADNGDSVRTTLPVESREYRDSTYRAIVSGVVAGGRRPSLDYIETYNTTTTTTVVQKERTVRIYATVGVALGNAQTVGGGIVINKFGIGAEYLHYEGKSAAMLRGIYFF